MAMTDAEYARVQETLIALAKQAQATITRQEIDDFLSRIETAEAMGPVLDPTLYIRASDRLEKFKRLADGLIPFLDAVYNFFR